MVTLILDYAVASPAVIAAYVGFYGCGEVETNWTDIDEDCFEFNIFGDNSDMVEDVMLKVMEEFVWG